MAAEVKILVEGYSNADKVDARGLEKTCPTITLVRDENLIIIVDPGILENQQVLIDALQKENLTIKDVNIVCITHSHIDHYRNIGMFPDAKTLEYYGLWDKRTIENWSENLTPSIQILYTPGHDYTGITLLVRTEAKSEYPGVVAICGDVFWRENYPQSPEDDIFASDPEKLMASRDMVLRMADWIIPGHGGIYKNDREVLPPIKEFSEKKKDKPFGICRKCQRVMEARTDSCRCRPYLCHRCCECTLDCDLCSCSHRKDRA